MLFKSLGRDDTTKVSLVQGLLISEKHPKSSCEISRKSGCCQQHCQCVLGAAHTSSLLSATTPGLDSDARQTGEESAP